MRDAVAHINENGVFSRERESSFSLRSREIGPLDFNGARRENVLRGAGYAWTSSLRVFDNSKRYDFLPTCVLFKFLRVFPCFDWFEAVRGHLIGPKTWNRIVRISWGFFPPSETAQKLGAVWVFLIPEFCFKSCICMEKGGIGPLDRSQNMGLKL